MTKVVPLTNSPRRVKLRVEDYLSLDAAGAFEPYGKTELLDGEIVYMNAQHRPHAWVKGVIYDGLRDALKAVGSPFRILSEASIALAESDAPEPDLTLTSEPRGPGLIPASSVALIVEVADSTLRNDLSRKHRIYARAGVPEYWVADVHGCVLHQMWAPAAERYAERRAVAFGASVTAATLPDLTIDTTEL